MNNCKKCGGVLVKDFEDMKCLICGYMEYNIPTNILKETEEAKGKPSIDRKISQATYHWDKEHELWVVEK